jgi:hypothetical protein
MDDDDVTDTRSLRKSDGAVVELKYERQEPPAESPSSDKEPLIPPFFHQLPAEPDDERCFSPPGNTLKYPIPAKRHPITRS